MLMDSTGIDYKVINFGGQPIPTVPGQSRVETRITLCHYFLPKGTN